MNKSWTNIASLHEKYRSGELTPTQVTRWYLDRIKKYNPKLNIYLTVTEDLALKQASELEAELKNKPDVLNTKTLFGVPVALKDLYMTKDVRTTAASRVLENYTAHYSATVVDRYLKAGAIMLGKLNCDAWAHGSTGENSDFGPTHNPWDPEYVAGGSSSGSAAAIAADLAMVTGGTDTGGSIRCPASFCSVLGLKPTYSRVSRYGVISMASSLDSIGHFTRFAADNAKVLSVTAGFDPHDATSSKTPVDNYSDFSRSDLKGLKIGIPKEYMTRGSKMTEGMDPEVETSVEKALVEIEKLGATLVDISLPNTPHALAAYYIIQPAEVSSNLARFDGIRYGSDRKAFGSEAKRRIILGTYTLSSGYYDAYYNTAQKIRTLIIEDFKKVFSQVDLIMAPVMPHLPFKIGQKVSDPLSLYLEDVLTVPVNLAGLPAISMPVDIVDKKFPVGLQVIAPAFEEKLLLEVANIYENATAWHTYEPSL